MGKQTFYLFVFKSYDQTWKWEEEAEPSVQTESSWTPIRCHAESKTVFLKDLKKCTFKTL